jgi:integrase
VVQYRKGTSWKRKAVGTDLEAALEAHARLRAVSTSTRAAPRTRTRRRGAEPLRLDNLLDEWLADQRLRNKANTLRCAIDRGGRVVEVIGPRKLAANLSSADVARFVEARRQTGSTDVTINAHLRILRAMLNFAVAERLLDEVPVRVRLLRTIDRKHVDVFDPNEIEEVLDAASRKVHRLVTIVAASGMRRDEALHLRWSDVDITKGRVDIRAKRYQFRKRDGTVVECEWSPKNYEERSVYVTSDVIRYLKRYRLGQRRSSDEDWIFQSDKRAGERWTNPTKAVRRAFEDAGIYEAGKLLHAIRHTVGTRLLRVTDLETARAQLGHRNIATTMKYVHTDDKRRRRAGEEIGLLTRRR